MVINVRNFTFVIQYFNFIYEFNYLSDTSTILTQKYF